MIENRLILVDQFGQELVVGNVATITFVQLDTTLLPAKILQQYTLGIDDFFNVEEEKDAITNTVPTVHL